MFRMTSPTWGDLEWDNGTWSGDPILVRLVESFIARGRPVFTIAVGPTPVAASEPDWVAWFTAKAALEPIAQDDVWESEPDMPAELFSYPDDAQA